MYRHRWGTKDMKSTCTCTWDSISNAFHTNFSEIEWLWLTQLCEHTIHCTCKLERAFWSSEECLVCLLVNWSALITTDIWRLCALAVTLVFFRLILSVVLDQYCSYVCSERAVDAINPALQGDTELGQPTVYHTKQNLPSFTPCSSTKQSKSNLSGSPHCCLRVTDGSWIMVCFSTTDSSCPLTW